MTEMLPIKGHIWLLWYWPKGTMSCADLITPIARTLLSCIINVHVRILHFVYAMFVKLAIYMLDVIILSG